MKFGVQLFGVLHGSKGTVLENLQALADAGITEVEPCFSFSPTLGLENVIWHVDWLFENIESIKKMGLCIRSAHIFAYRLTDSIETLRHLAKAVGIRQFVVKTPEVITPLSLQQAALTYQKAADALAEDGILLLLHNEAVDIQTKIAGKTAYEHLLDLCAGKLWAQVDVGWVKYGGEDPIDFLNRNAWRVKSLHHKDFSDSAEPIDVRIGTGSVDIQACFNFARAHNIPQLIDRDHLEGNGAKELAETCAMLSSYGGARSRTVSYLNTYDIVTGEVKTLARFSKVIEAPNWLKESDTILYNADGYMFAFDLKNWRERPLATGICDNCNNDHVVSPDEKWLAVSHMSVGEGFTSRIYTVPLEGGAARLVTPNTPSFLHGWSPDGSELAYCAFREVDGKQEVDVYTIPVTGGAERRLTMGGFNDGPEYSPDGQYIWFNSTRSGLMQIWRMNRDGSGQIQITKNARNNWFAHPAPDGETVVYLSYGAEQLEPHEHLPNMPVELWQMDANGENQHKILSLFGGQGSLNVNSWAKDSRRFAFVSYEMV